MQEIGRLLTAMVTPMDDEGKVDYAQARRLAQALVESGSHGVVVSGTTGEAPTLSDEEKVRLVREVKEALGHRGTVVAGTGTYDTAHSIELSREAQKAGADALLHEAQKLSAHQAGSPYDGHVEALRHGLDVGPMVAQGAGRGKG
jgi:4-hydroxy-tetrahydrodipicolinate synthase